MRALQRSLMRDMLVAFAVAVSACGGGESDEGVAPPCDPNAKGTICTIARSGVQAFGGDNGPALLAEPNVPHDMVVSPEGELWILDFNNYLGRVVDKKGIIRTVIGTGLLGDSPAPGNERIPALQAEFNHTTDLFFDGGYLYLA